MKRADSIFYLEQLIAALMLFVSTRTEALVFCVTNEADYHQQAPTGTLAQSGWQQTVKIDCLSQRITWLTNKVAGVTFPVDLEVSWRCQTNHTTVEKYLDPIKDIRHTGGARVCVPRTSRRSSLPECGIVLLA